MNGKLTSGAKNVTSLFSSIQCLFLGCLCCTCPRLVDVHALSCIDCHMLPFLSKPVEHSISVFGALPQLFPSSITPPKKLGGSSEALFHVLTVRLVQYIGYSVAVSHAYIIRSFSLIFTMTYGKSVRSEYLYLGFPRS